MISPEIFITHSLSVLPEGQMVARILAASINAVDPGNAVMRSVSRNGELLLIGDREYDLGLYRRVYVVGAGKASQRIARSLEPLLVGHLSAGIIISKPSLDSIKNNENNLVRKTGNRIIELSGSHPIPDQHSLDSTSQLIGLVSGLRENDLVIALISGGASALLCAPVEGIPLPDLQQLHRMLLACGARIDEINTVRKHIDHLKGGGLAGLVFPAQLVTLILSDVVGSPLDSIASGPTVPDPSTFTDAENVLKKFRIWDETPNSIRRVIQNGKENRMPETLKSGDYRFKNVQNNVIGSNQDACLAAYRQAREEGLSALVLTTFLQGEARAAGGFLAAIVRQMALHGQPLDRPACLIAGGETIVIKKARGIGGRNLEVALGAVDAIAGLSNVAIITLATDGEDGPTDAAGAVVTGETGERALSKRMVAETFLDTNNSYEYFAQLNDLIKTGSTGTNANDMSFVFAF